MHFSAFDAYSFDLDGVITPTAEVHMKAWSETFNAFLVGFPGQKPWTGAGCFAHVDGKPRYDGVRDFLVPCGIELPEDDPSDAAIEQSICGLRDRKNETFNEIIHRDGVASYPRSGAPIDTSRTRGVKLAVVSSLCNAVPIPCAAGLEAVFPMIVDGNVAKEQGSAGRLAFDTFKCAAKQPGVESSRAVVTEDTLPEVTVGTAGGFGFIVGADRGVGPETLRRADASLVVADLGGLMA